MKYFLQILTSIIMFSCENLSILSGAGTHGSISSYSFSISKDSLVTVINKFISEQSKIKRLQADGETYVKISIGINGNDQFIVFRYAGDEEYWQSHPNKAHISITAVKKGEGEYKNESKIGRKEKMEAIKIFEEYFIKELEKQTMLKSIRN